MNTSDWYNKIKDFMENAGQLVPDRPEQLDKETAKLRARLIMEEAFETCVALGVSVHIDDGHGTIGFDDLSFSSHYPTHTLSTIDGCCDLIYVTLGTLVSMGLPDDPFIQEVCENNLTKVHPTCVIKDGKVQKPEGYQPPNLAKVLDQVLEETR